MAIYNFADAVRHTAADAAKVQRWCDAGIITTGGGGSQGKRREFSMRNLIEIRVCDELRGLGVGEPFLRRVVKDLNTIWNQPDDPLTMQPNAPTHRDATILWIAFQRLADPDTPRETHELCVIFPVTEAILISRLTDGQADGSGVAESGIAVPLARIIRDLEVATGDVFDIAAAVTRLFREAWDKETEKEQDKEKIRG